jgi:signal transduction histidine kinase
VKFSTDGSDVRLEAVPHGERMRFSVADTGRGIPAEKLETIFDRFQQVDTSDSRDKGGTGLGLAICRSIVDGHGGRIWAASAPGQGSTFYVELPSATALAAAA